MAKETDEVRGHKFDDIQEFDNPLPQWWVWLFYATIAFAIAYVPWVLLGDGNLLIDEYQVEMKAAEALLAKQQVRWDNAELEQWCGGGDAWRAPAAATYKAKCAACHRADGGGAVGPAFTDDVYLHGGKRSDIAKVITEGVPAKGMIAWGKLLQRSEIRDLACYVRDLRGKTVAKPKAPQGLPAQE